MPKWSPRLKTSGGEREETPPSTTAAAAGTATAATSVATATAAAQAEQRSPEIHKMIRIGKARFRLRSARNR